MRTYGGLGRFLIDMGAPAVDALLRMETKGLSLTPYNLRHLEHLLTPAGYGCDGLRGLPTAGVGQGDCLRRHEQWCKFHWLAHPEIDDTKRMHLTPLITLNCIVLKCQSFHSFETNRTHSPL